MSSIQNQILTNSKEIAGNGKVSNTKSPGLRINLADHELEVRGFGLPIKASAARKIAMDHFKDCIAINKLIDEIDKDKTGAYAKIKKNPGYAALKEVIGLDSHVVSGVFGKEAILQLLSQKNAEGIRYTIGKFDGKTTIVLTAVEETTPGKRHANGTVTPPVSNPLGGYKSYAPGKEHDPTAAINIEVHSGSHTVPQMLKLYPKHPTD